MDVVDTLYNAFVLLRKNSSFDLLVQLYHQTMAEITPSKLMIDQTKETGIKEAEEKKELLVRCILCLRSAHKALLDRLVFCDECGKSGLGGEYAGAGLS